MILTERERAVAADKEALLAYKDAAAANDFARACTAGARMRPQTQGELIRARCGLDICHGDEVSCYEARKDVRREDAATVRQSWQESSRRVEQEKKAELDARLRRHSYTPGQGTGGPSAAERLKQSNDYLYGSGKASTCPYTDRSLCN